MMRNRGKVLLSIKNNPKTANDPGAPQGGPKPVLTPSAIISSRFHSVGRSDARRAVSDGILPPKEGIRVASHRWLITVDVRRHFKPSPPVVHVSGSKIYNMVLTGVRVVYAKSLQIKR
jgi:hypothetical protein